MNEPGKTRIAVVGAGQWGRNLLRNLVAHPRVALAALADPDAESLANAARSFRPAATFDSFDAMIAAGGIDAVVVASPSRLHFRHARTALQAGCDVFVEKPMCMTAVEGRELLARADAKRRVLMVGHTFLYSNLVHEVKRRIDSGVLGDVLCVYSQRLNLGRVRSDVDALWNFAPHDVSITAFLLDAWPETVNAHGGCFIQREAGIADVAFFQMDFARGCMMGGHVSWLDPQKVRRMVVVGSERMLVYDDVDSTQHIQVYDKSVQAKFQEGHSSFAEFQGNVRAGDLVIPNVRLAEPLAVEIDHFVQCVETRQRPRTDGVNGLRVVCVLEAMSKSMRNGGARINVDYGFTGSVAGKPSHESVGARSLEPELAAVAL